MIIVGFNSLYPRSNYSGNYTIDVRIEAKLPTKWTHEKAEVGRAREEKRREEREEEERVRRKKMQVREKVGKSRFTAFFQWFVGPKGRKVGSLKRRVQSHLAKWEMKNCTPLWREAHLEVKKLKTPRVGSTFGSCDVEKCTPLWREAHLEVKMYKTHYVQSTFGSCDVQEVYAAVARSTFRSRNVPKKMAGVGHLKRICKDGLNVAGAVQETCSSEMLGGQAADFLRRVALWSIRSSGLRRWFCVTGAALRLGITFSWQAQNFRQMEWKNRKTRWYEALCIQLSILEGGLAEFFCFWRYQVRKLREVSQNCCDFDVIKFKNEKVSQTCFVFQLA